MRRTYLLSFFCILFALSYTLEGRTLQAACHQGEYLGYPRNYGAVLNTQERADIRYIVTSLANKSLVWLLSNKSSLEGAGDRISHIHPLRFLAEIFIDEELKVGIRNIRPRGWVWGDFIGGFKQSLATEYAHNNLCYDQVVDFANTVGIDPALIISSVEQQQWETFVNLLITHIPRKGDHDRYDF